MRHVISFTSVRNISLVLGESNLQRDGQSIWFIQEPETRLRLTAGVHYLVWVCDKADCEDDFLWEETFGGSFEQLPCNLDLDDIRALAMRKLITISSEIVEEVDAERDEPF